MFEKGEAQVRLPRHVSGTLYPWLMATTKVLFGVTVPFTANAFLREQAHHLAQSGWVVELVSGVGQGLDSLQSDNHLRLHVVQVHRGTLVPKDLIGLLQIVVIMLRSKPDVVVMSTPKVGLVGLFAAWLTRTPVRVYHVRGLRAEGLTGVARTLNLLAERLSTAMATSVLCDSESLLNVMRQLRCLPPTKGMVLGKGGAKGIDVSHFRPATPDEKIHARDYLGFTRHDFVVGFVGRITKDKGIWELIDALKLIRREDPTIKLLVVGPIEEPAAHQEFVKNQDWLLWLDQQDDVVTSLWCMDIFCLPSYREGLPIAILEASSTGLPVVTTDSTGCRDAVIHDTTGQVVPARDSIALAQALQALRSDAGLRRHFGEQGRLEINQFFSASEVDERFVNFLASLSSQRA